MVFFEFYYRWQEGRYTSDKRAFSRHPDPDVHLSPKSHYQTLFEHEPQDRLRQGNQGFGRPAALSR